METSRALFPVIPLVCGPVVIVGMYMVFKDTLQRWGSPQNGIVSVVFLMLTHYQTVVIIRNTDIVFPLDLASVFQIWGFTDDITSIFRTACAGFGRFETGMALRVCGPVVLLLVVLLVYFGSKFVGVACGIPKLAMQWDRTHNVFFSILFTFFNGIAAMSLTLFRCMPNPNGKLTLRADPSIVCFGEAWSSMIVAGVLAVLIYCVGFGGLIVYVISVARDRFADKGFQMRWKFLFIKYRPDVFWWSVVFLMRGLLMNIGIAAFQDGLLQVYSIMTVEIIYKSLTIAYLPWRHIKANAMEMLIGVSLLYCCTQ